MVSEDRVVSYIESLDKGIPSYLDEIAVSARERSIPIIRPAMMNYMHSILALYKPMTILEIGCAIGFSALLMREFSPSGCKIVTIENYEPRIVEAKENFYKYDTNKQITLIEGDAVEILKTLEAPKGLGDEGANGYDMIFMDAAKGQYLNMYGDVKRLLHRGGLLLADNVLQEGDILESRYAIARRDRTIHTRMREYLYQLSHDDDYVTSILPIADGVAFSVKQ